MESKKHKPAAAPAGKPAAASKAAASKAEVRAIAPEAPLATPAVGNSQRLLREAAWSRMFGRTEAKNPFARSR